MARFIVNADDFGISEDVNDAIRLCFEKRIITNTTLMVNMPYAVDAVNIAKQQNFDDRVGLHLNLTAGVPLTYPIRGMSTFCDSNGHFHAGFHQHTMTRMHLGKKESMAVMEEAEAQIRRYLALGLPEKHIDSHHHVHTDIAVWRVIEPILKKYDFRSVRISRNVYYNGRCSAANRLYKCYYNRRLSRSGMKITDYFGSYKDFKGDYNSVGDNALAEMMLHPMFAEDGELMDTRTPMVEVRDFFAEKHIMQECY